MPSTPVWFGLLILVIAGERLAELVIARRNRRWSLSQGGVEYGAGHYPVIVGLQVGLLVGSVLEVWLRRPDVRPGIAVSMLALVLAAQGLRWWCIRTLGRQWNTRIIVIPGHERVHRGPYRWLPHPNYLAVVIEGAALPLIGAAWITAVVFTIANVAVLSVRIRVENTALATLGGDLREPR